MRAPIDVATVALGLAALGFGIVALLAPHLSASTIQPILALTLAAAGTIGLLIRGRTSGKKSRKELP